VRKSLPPAGLSRPSLKKREITDWVVADAVGCEPVSAEENGKNNGKVRQIAATGPSKYRKRLCHRHKPRICGKKEMGKRFEEMGKTTKEMGNFSRFLIRTWWVAQNS
jgi:hypothetical protein